MPVATPMPAATPYWNFIKDSSNEVKLNLITLLSMSIEHAQTSKKAESDSRLVDELCGSWLEDGMTADELVAEITSGRNNNRDILNL